MSILKRKERKDKSLRTRIISFAFRTETFKYLDRFMLWWDTGSRSATVSKVLADFVLNSRYHDDFFQFAETHGLFSFIHEKSVSSHNLAFSVPNWVLDDLDKVLEKYKIKISNLSVIVRSIISYLYSLYFCEIEPELVNDIMKRLSGGYVVQGIFKHPEQGLISIRVIRSKIVMKKSKSDKD